MTDHPDAAELLRIARACFVEAILPGLAGEQRFTGLMIANAMAIAAREIAGGDRPAREALDRMRHLLEEPSRPVASSELEASLRDHDRRLAAAIREGRLDDSQALLDHLLKTAGAKLAVSNPKVLGA
jgi:hypothetical protein